MRRFHEWMPGDISDPALRRRHFLFLGWLWGLLFIGMFATTTLDGVTRRARSAHPGGEYVSEARFGGIPVLAIGSKPRGIVALGDQPVGVVAVGGVAIGGIAIGGLAVGGIAFGGMSAGLFAIGGFGLGIWAIGGGAVGHYALGGLAVGNHAYAGNGIAIGRYEACGRQKERLVG
jgi:hypothetical protein